jgi:DNA-binding LacI/PurR family transcriptional regulator
MLRSQRSKLLGVVFTAGQEFHAGLVDGVYRAADVHGYDVLLSCVTPHHSERQAVRTLLDDRCEALVLIGSELPARELADLDARLPVVVVTRKVRGVDAVRNDDARGAALAVAHLAELGHRSVTYIDGGRAPGAAERRNGLRRAATETGMSYVVMPGGRSESDGAAAAVSMLESGLPTAIFAFNDRCALGVIDVLIRAGVRVPEDVSVIGFDDSPLAGLAHVNLTTVGQDTAGLAERAVGRAIGRIDDDAVDTVDEVCEPRLVVRGSTSPPDERAQTT